MKWKLRKKKHVKLLKRKIKIKAKASQLEQRIKLKYSEYLDPFMDVIDNHYKPQDISLFRWMHSPEIPDDFLPQIFQESDARNVDSLDVPSVDDPEYVILDYVDYFTLSNFDSIESAEKRYNDVIKNFSKRKDADERIKNFIKNKGIYVEKINYTKSTALVCDSDSNGHIQTLIMEGVNVEDLVDRNFEPYKINVHYEA